MNKKLIIALIGLSLLACNFLFPPKASPTPKPETTAVPVEKTTVPEMAFTARPTEEMPVPKPATATSTPTTGFTIVRLHPQGGDLKTLLAKNAAKAVALGQLPVVEFDATWCPPCQAIDQGIQEKNELVLDAYAGTYIMKLDVDEWGWGDSKLHDFDFDGIPVYFQLDGDGNPTGKTVDGNAWGENIPENFAPVMDEFFHGE